MLPPKRREEYVKKLQQAFDQGQPHRREIEQRMHQEPALTSLKP